MKDNLIASRGMGLTISADLPPIRTCSVETSDLPEHLRPFFAAHKQGEHFINPWEKPLTGRFKQFMRWRTSRNPWAGAKRRSPQAELLDDAAERFLVLPESGRIAWLGHASLLIQIDGLSVLIDPILGRIGGVIPRKVKAPMSVEQLPHIDVVLLSHGHYDHLDAGSLKALSKRFGEELLFATPLGLSKYLPGRCQRRIELDWWESIELAGVEIHLVPAQHWHKRTLADTNKALWGGWIVRGSSTVYHSGDTGYFGGFSAIGHRFPGIDVASLPIGAYEPRWFMKPQHMNPAESVQALTELGAARMLAMHWGTFDLSDEPLDEGTRALEKALMAAELAPDRALVLPHGGSLPLATSREHA